MWGVRGVRCVVQVKHVPQHITHTPAHNLVDDGIVHPSSLDVDLPELCLRTDILFVPWW